MHASVSGGRAYGTFCFLCLRRSIFADHEAVFSEDRYSRRRRFWWIHVSGTGGEAFCTVFLCAFAVEFSRSGGERGKGFRGSLPSVAVFLVYTCQRVRRMSGLNFVFALAPLDFLGPRGGVFGGSLPSAGALLVYSCQRVGRANEVIFSFCASAVKISRIGGGVFWKIFTIGDGAFGILMSAYREDERTELYFGACAVPFSRSGGGVFGGSLRTAAAALLVYACQRVGGENGVNYIFCASALKFSRTGGGVPADLYNRGRRFWYMHASVSGGRADLTIFLCLRGSILPERGVFSRDLYDRRRCF